MNTTEDTTDGVFPPNPTKSHTPSRAALATRVVLVALLLAGLAIRLLYLFELQEHPDFQIPMLFQTDMGFIDNSALDHAQRMRDFFRLPPVEPKFERHIAWRHHPGNPQLRPPAYTFFLSALYFVLGDAQFGVRLVQMLLGLCSALLGYCLGKSLLGRGAGLLMAGFMTLYWPFIIYEASLHEPVMVVFCSVLFLNAALWWLRRPNARRAFAMGLACGLYTVAAAAIILFLPVLLAWVVWALWCRRSAALTRFPNGGRREVIGKALGQAGVVLIAFFVPILPITALNYGESGRFVLNSFGQGITLYIGNQPESQGYLLGADDLLDVYLGEAAEGLRVDEKVNLIDDWWRWASLAREAAAEHILANPAWFLQLSVKRALLFWSPHEISQNVTDYADRLFSRVLWRVPGNFGMVFALFLVGLLYYGLAAIARLRSWAGLLRRASSRDAAVLVREDRATAKRQDNHPQGGGGDVPNFEGFTLVLLLILVWYGPYLVLWISAHFRVPLLPAIAAFAVLGVAQTLGHLRGRRFIPAAAGMVLGASVLVLMSLVPHSYEDDIQTWLYFRVQHYARHEEPQKLLDIAERVVKRAPNHVFARRIHAQALLDAGKKEEALTAFQQVLPEVEEPEVAASLAEVIGLLHRDFKDNAAARDAFLTAIRHDPDRPASLHGLGNIAFEEGNHEEAIRYLERARAVEPDRSNTCFLLGMAHAAVGDPARAEEAYRAGIAIDPDDIWPVLGLANLLSNTGRVEEACALIDGILARHPENPQAHQAKQDLCHPPIQQ